MSAARATDARIKGAAVREFLRWVEATRGDGTLRAAATALPPTHARHFDVDAAVLGLLASNWYPAAAIHALLDVLLDGTSEEERRALSREGSRAVMDVTLKGIYRTLFAWMATPERYARHAHRLWRTYYDSGDFQLAPDPDGKGSVTSVRDWDGHHPFICELNRDAAVAIYTVMGCHEVSCQRQACVSRGDGECRFHTRWKM